METRDPSDKLVLSTNAMRENTKPRVTRSHLVAGPLNADSPLAWDVAATGVVSEAIGLQAQGLRHNSKQLHPVDGRPANTLVMGV